jgi:hypothetical protein
MFDYSPADDNDRPPDYADANAGDGYDDGTFAVPLGYRYTDVHGVVRVVGESWFT